MNNDSPSTAEAAAADGDTDRTTAGDEQVVDEMLVEEISIDGMCGVY